MMINQDQAQNLEANVDKERVSVMFNMALEAAYGNGFEAMTEMFRGVSDPKAFGRRMAQIIVSLLDFVEDKMGEQASDEDLAYTGLLLVAQIYADLVEGGLIQENDEMVHAALQMAMATWMSKHPDRVDEQQLRQAAMMAGTMPGQDGMQAPQGAPAGNPDPTAGAAPQGASQGLLGQMMGGGMPR